MTARRFLFIVLAALLIVGCDMVKKLTGERGVRDVYEDLEEAYRTGDGELWLSIQSKEALEAWDQAFITHMEKQGFPPQPDIRMELLNSIERGEKGALFLRFEDEQGDTQYESLILVVENDEWKISEMHKGNAPVHPHAFFPPDPGAFMVGGARWQEVPYVVMNDDALSSQASPWRMKGALDESFLYVRLEGERVLPEPGSVLRDPTKAVLPPVPFPIAFIAVSGEGAEALERGFHITVGEGVTTHTTFDDTGRADKTRYYLNYSFTLYDQETFPVFDNSTSASTALIEVQDRYVDIRIPRDSLGFGPDEDFAVTFLEDSYYQPYAVQRFH